VFHAQIHSPRVIKEGLEDGALCQMDVCIWEHVRHGCLVSTGRAIQFLDPFALAIIMRRLDVSL
jgi:hypothetical protein